MSEFPMSEYRVGALAEFFDNKYQTQEVPPSILAKRSKEVSRKIEKHQLEADAKELSFQTTNQDEPGKTIIQRKKKRKIYRQFMTEGAEGFQRLDVSKTETDVSNNHDSAKVSVFEESKESETFSAKKRKGNKRAEVIKEGNKKFKSLMKNVSERELDALSAGGAAGAEPLSKKKLRKLMKKGKILGKMAESIDLNSARMPKSKIINEVEMKNKHLKNVQTLEKVKKSKTKGNVFAQRGFGKKNVSKQSNENEVSTCKGSPSKIHNATTVIANDTNINPSSRSSRKRKNKFSRPNTVDQHLNSSPSKLGESNSSAKDGKCYQRLGKTFLTENSGEFTKKKKKNRNKFRNGDSVVAEQRDDVFKNDEDSRVIGNTKRSAVNEKSHEISGKKNKKMKFGRGEESVVVNFPRRGQQPKPQTATYDEANHIRFSDSDEELDFVSCSKKKEQKKKKVFGKIKSLTSNSAMKLGKKNKSDIPDLDEGLQLTGFSSKSEDESCEQSKLSNPSSTAGKAKARASFIAVKNYEKEKLGDPEKVNRTLFIGNIPIDMGKKDLKKIFQAFGKVDSVRFRSAVPVSPSVPQKVANIKHEYHESVTSLKAYVVFEKAEDAEQALKINGTVVNGHHLRVDKAGIDKTKNGDKRTVFIGNLPFDVEDEALWTLFSSRCNVVNVRVIRDRETGIGKGFGFVSFQDANSVEAALALEGSEVGGRNIRIKRTEGFRKENPQGPKQKKEMTGGRARQGGFRKSKFKQNNTESRKTMKKLLNSRKIAKGKKKIASIFKDV